jgi:hypothetical protein
MGKCTRTLGSLSCTEEKLKEQFLNFSKDFQPLNNYCQKALRFKEVAVIPDSTDTDGVIVQSSLSSAFACFTNDASLSFTHLKKIVPDCTGFPLSIINITEECENDCSLQVLKFNILP